MYFARGLLCLALDGTLASSGATDLAFASHPIFAAIRVNLAAERVRRARAIQQYVVLVNCTPDCRVARGHGDYRCRQKITGVR